VAGTLARRFRLIRGGAAERQAETFLCAQGLNLVERNYRCRMGELDLVMMDADCLVVVEVRFRHSDRFVPALQTVDEVKQARIIRATRHFLAARHEFADCAVRFDVVAIEGPQRRAVEIQWVSDAFRV
jgi:putative endonuclease